MKPIKILVKIPQEQSHLPIRQSWTEKTRHEIEVLISPEPTGSNGNRRIRVDVVKSEAEDLYRARIDHAGSVWQIVEDLPNYMSENTPTAYNRHAIAEELRLFTEINK